MSKYTKIVATISDARCDVDFIKQLYESGMNVDIHLESFPHAFIFIILLSAILSAVTFVWFRRIKWF